MEGGYKIRERNLTVEMPADIWWKKGINWSVQMNSVDMSEI